MSEAETDNNTAAAEEAGDSIVVRVFGRTDVGLVREHNEDNFLIADLASGNRSIKPEVRTHTVGAKGSLFAVCDGMGGAAAGEVASRIAVDTIYEMMQEGDVAADDRDLARRLDLAIREAGSRIYTAARLNRGQRGMGTTVTAAVLNGQRLLIGQVGDSRAHVLRDGEMIQVTKDQSLVQQLIDAKQLTEEEAKHFDKSNIILQALGTTEEVHVDMTSVELQQGDALVMCSDGLSGLVEPEAIRDAVLEIDDPMEACRKLTDMACDAGGDDNITVIVARFDGAKLAATGAGNSLGYQRFEYPKAGEVTVRSGYPKDPSAPPEEQQEAEEAAPAQDQAEPAPPEEQPAAAEQPAPEPEPEPAPATEPAEPPTEGGGEPAEPRSRSRAGPIIASVAVVLIGASIGGYFLFRGNASGQGLPQASGVAPGSAQQPTAPVNPSMPSPPLPAAPRVDAQPEVEAPPLNPIDEQAIIGSQKGRGKGGETETDDDAQAAPVLDGIEKEFPEDGSEGGEPAVADGSGDEPEAKDEAAGSEDATQAAAKKKGGGKKSGKGKKKKESLIPDNPFD
jgi:protein phosphatase